MHPCVCVARYLGIRFFHTTSLQVVHINAIYTSDSKKFSILKKEIGIEGEKITETS